MDAAVGERAFGPERGEGVQLALSLPSTSECKSGVHVPGDGGELLLLLSEQDEDGSLVICRVSILGLGGAPGKGRVCARGLVGPSSGIVLLPCFCVRFSPSRNCLGSNTLHHIPCITFSGIYRQ